MKDEAKNLIDAYVEKRYNRWLDYAEYHCNIAGIHDEATDVLNEVLLSLLKKDMGKLTKLLKTKKSKYTELDYFVLRMIKLNVYSSTSPYRHKYKAIPKAEGVEISRLEIVDDREPERDGAAETLKEMRLIRYVFHGITPDLSEDEKQVFHWRLSGENLSHFNAEITENQKYTYSAFVSKTVHQILFNQGLTTIEPKNTTPKQKTIAQNFFNRHQIKIINHGKKQNYQN